MTASFLNRFKISDIDELNCLCNLPLAPHNVVNIIYYFIDFNFYYH